MQAWKKGHCFPVLAAAAACAFLTIQFHGARQKKGNIHAKEMYQQIFTINDVCLQTIFTF